MIDLNNLPFPILNHMIVHKLKYLKIKLNIKRNNSNIITINLNRFQMNNKQLHCVWGDRQEGYGRNTL